MPVTVGIVTFDGAEELDFVGPWEVFTAAQMDHEDDQTVLVAESLEPVTCAKGLVVTPQVTFADCPTLDVVLVPGGMGTRVQMKNDAMLDFLRETATTCDWVTSVCTGSFVLHGAGLVEGRRVTTHWAAVEELQRNGHPDVVTGFRFVRDGHVVTAEGVSAGIDMALWLVGQLYSPDHARLTQRYIQYEPAPPYTADV